jgi:hypothetical protein
MDEMFRNENITLLRVDSTEGNSGMGIRMGIPEIDPHQPLQKEQ